jgi:hypothetical protein
MGMPSNIQYSGQYSGGQYAQGLVLAEIQAISPVMATFIENQKDALVQMSKLALNSTLSAAAHTMWSSVTQGGMSLAGAAAGGVNAESGLSSVNESIADNTKFTGERSVLEQQLQLAKSPELEIKSTTEMPEGDSEPKGDVLNLATGKNHSDPSTPPDMKHLERRHKDLLQDHKQRRKIREAKHDSKKTIASAVQAGAEALLQPTKGGLEKSQQEKQGLQNIQNQSSQQAETAKEQSVSTWTSLIQGVGEVQGYTSAMAR